MSNVIRVIAAVVDVHNLTLYKEDGSEYLIKQGDPELKRVLDIVMPIIQDGGVAEVDLGVSADTGKEFKDFEAKSGLIKFFKVLKADAEKYLAALTAAPVEHVSPVTYGRVPSNNPAVNSVTVKKKGGDNQPAAPSEAKQAKAAAVAEILANAVPTSSENFSAPLADKHGDKGELIAEGAETMIAVVGDDVVPGVEKLSTQFEYAARAGNSTVGMERFLERIGKVIKQRNHSVQDLLKFLERGDLPIADDGCFVAYKILRDKGNSRKVFEDCHTRRVPQKVGSYVHMDIALVDPDRRNECSNGLHVARRGYIGNFSGDLCTLIKVAPEDVIAVPEYDANKMRVCGYHIIDLLSQEDYRKLCNNNAMTDNMAAKIQLGKALAGEHVGILEYVKITEQRGGGVIITPAANKTEAKKAVAKQKSDTKKRTAEAIKAKPVGKAGKGAAKVDATAIAKQVAQQKTTGGSARQQKAADLYATYCNAVNNKDKYEAAKVLVAFKKAAKVGWEKLGITEMQGQCVASAAATEPVFQEEEVAPAPTRKAVKKAATKPVSKPTENTVSGPTDRQKAMQALMSQVKKGNVAAAVEVLTKKKASKKSWEALGLTKADGEACDKVLKKAKK